MTGSERMTVFDGAELPERLDGLDLGKGRILLEPATEEMEFDLLDTFDGQVAAKGALLVAAGDALILLEPHGLLQQERAAPGFVSDLPQGPVTERLRRLVSPLRTLMRVAEGHLTRQAVRGVDDLDKTHLRGTLWVFAPICGGTVSLLEMAALRGYAPTLARLEAALAPVVEEIHDARGAAQALRGTGASAPVLMAPDETAFRAAGDIIRSQLAVARQQEPGVLADLDSEFLHDYRVALRRVRSVVSLFKGVYSAERTTELKARFGAVMAHTGRLRDLDVYLIERDKYLSLVPEAMRPGLGKLFDRLAAERQAELKVLTAWMDSDAYRAELHGLARLFEKPKRLTKGPEAERPALDYAKTLIWKRYRKVNKIARGIDDATPDAEVHELRIACKKLRYLIEFFTPLFDDPEVPRLVKALKRLQDNLGNFNDYSVQQAALGRVAEDLARDPGPDGVAIATSLGALVTVLHQRQMEERARITSSFAAFDGPDTQAGFRRIFKPEEGTA